MAGHDPLSTRVGNILSGMVGPQLAIKFHSEAGGATLPGETVLVEGLPGLPSNGVFFLNLVPWDGNRDGNAVQVSCSCVLWNVIRFACFKKLGTVLTLEILDFSRSWDRALEEFWLTVRTEALDQLLSLYLGPVQSCVFLTELYPRLYWRRSVYLNRNEPTEHLSWSVS